MAPPLFIIGTSRSGTSWAFELCASHPDMSMGYESKLPVEGASVYRRHPPAPGDQAAMAGLFERLDTEIDDPTNAELFTRLRRPDVIDRAVAAHESEPGWPAICETVFRSLEDTPNWGNKLLRLELAPVLLELWPDARILVLTRDPRGVMASQEKKFGHSIEYSSAYWNTHSGIVSSELGLAPGQHDETYFVTDLVQMATDPRPTLEWAFSGVGLDTSPIDALIERYPGDPDRLDAWRSTIDARVQRKVEQYCYDEMVALGYQPELATEQRHMGAVTKLWSLVREHGAELVRDPGSIRRKQVLGRVKAMLRGAR